MATITQSAPWPVLLGLAALYILGYALSVAVVYGIIKTAINKATPENLPMVIRELTRLRVPAPHPGRQHRAMSRSLQRGDNGQDKP